MQRAPLPEPSLNGGLYSGELFNKGAPWANVPAVPDSGFLIHYNLVSAAPPPGAQYQYPGGEERPGNNYTTFPGVGPAPGGYGILVNPGPCASTPVAPCKCRKCTFPGKYVYW